MLTRTLGNSNLVLTWTLYHSILLSTQTNFCFPSAHVYIINWGKNSVLKSKTLNLFQNNHVNFCLYFFVKLSVHPCIFYQTLLLCFNQGFLLNQSISLAALEVKCVSYLLSLPIHLLISLFLVICFERPLTRTPDNSNFFWFPRRFELSEVNCTCFTLQNLL